MADLRYEKIVRFKSLEASWLARRVTEEAVELTGLTQLAVV